MADLLQELARRSRARAAEARRRVPEPTLRRRAEAAVPPVALRPDPSGFDLIAEFKPAAPSAGRLLGPGAASASRVARAARRYAAAGAAAVSVLTEPSRFEGRLEWLVAAAGACPEVPVLRKDFLVSPYQVLEARAAGASGALLIARLEADVGLGELLGTALALGMFALVELFDERDLDRAGPVLAEVPTRDRCRVLVGVNTRDLRSLEIDPRRLERLAPRLPAGFVRVAESGIESAADAGRASALGYRMALVGAALMRAPDPQTRIRELLVAGRVASRQDAGGAR